MNVVALARPLVTCCVLVGLSASTVSAQNPNYPGYLGVYVREGFGGMQITGFIPQTPAAALAWQGNISAYDTILSLGGRPTHTLHELRYARNMIPDGQEAKMVLRSNGQLYHVWISRSQAVAAMMLGKSGPGSPDVFTYGGKGKGNDGDFRVKQPGGGNQHHGGQGPHGNHNGPDYNGGPSSNDGNFRDKQ